MTSINKIMAELIGAFLLSFIGAGAICVTAADAQHSAGLLGIAVAHGLILSIAVSATMNISGGHLNPAVTVCMLVTRRISIGDAIQYIIAQLIGATIAGALVYLAFRDLYDAHGVSAIVPSKLGTPHYHDVVPVGKAILFEAMMTFVLVIAIFGTAVDPRAPKVGGFGIGLAIAADILFGGPITGASMNPSRTFGPGIVAYLTGNFAEFPSQQLVYWVGPIAGALLAAIIYDNFIMEKKRA